MTDRYVYVVRYALDGPIRRVRLVAETANYIRVEWPGGYNDQHSFERKFVADSLDDAQARVKAMAAAKIKLLQKQIRAMERIINEGAKVEGEDA